MTHVRRRLHWIFLGAMLFSAWCWGASRLALLGNGRAWGADPSASPYSPPYAPGPYGTNPFALPFTGPVVPVSASRPGSWPGGKDSLGGPMQEPMGAVKNAFA